jgi:uncharacterized protein
MPSPGESLAGEPAVMIDWDVAIEMDDGLILRADVFRPRGQGRHPVILSYGPYAKGLAFQEGYPDQWQRMVRNHPDVAAGSSNRYQNWEVVDPEKWVPAGYACVRVDSRGAGRSPGIIDPFSERETTDLVSCIDWAAAQPWSSGKVGLNGISYYGINQWLVASRQPAHLAAICVWEGAADFYRDMTHHGGILCTFFPNWYDMQVKTVQHGLGSRGPRHPLTGVNACGDVDLSEDELAANRTDFAAQITAHAFDDDYHRERSADFSRIETPLLTAGNWGGHGLHLRGNVEGFTESASDEKWLELHGLEHWSLFYTDYGRDLQLQFFDHFLKGEDNGWNRRPRVLAQIRHLDHFQPRSADSWPLPDTQWTRLYLNPDLTLSPWEAPGAVGVGFEALGEGITFRTDPLSEATEITGPSALRLFVSSTTPDADLFVVLRLFDPEENEITFQGALDPHSPLAHGWLRASHRELDPIRSLPWRPYHPHESPSPLEPGEIYELEIEVWPTSIVAPAGYRLAVSVQGHDYEYTGPGSAQGIRTFKNPFTGVGPFLHDSPVDRSPDVFGGLTTIHLGPAHPSAILLPVIPPDDQP